MYILLGIILILGGFIICVVFCLFFKEYEKCLDLRQLRIDIRRKDIKRSNDEFQDD